MKRVMVFTTILLTTPVALVILYFRVAYGLVDVIFQAVEEERQNEFTRRND